MSDLNLDALYRQAKAQWLKTEAPKRDFLDLVSGSIPYWLIVISAGFFLLSIPHTIHMFNTITPGFGIFGTFGVEFGLLYAAFRRKSSAVLTQSIPGWLRLFEILLIVTSVLVNGAGALTAVVNSSGIQQLSTSDILQQLGNLPLTAQVGLVVALAASLIIPAGAIVSGEGLADLVLQRSGKKISRLEMIWTEQEFTVFSRTIFNELTHQGNEPSIAAALAKRYAQGYITGTVKGKPVLLENPVSISTSALPERSVVSAESGKRKTESSVNVDAFETDLQRKIAAWLLENPERLNLSGRAIADEVKAIGIKVTHPTANAIKEVVKSQMNTLQ